MHGPPASRERPPSDVLAPELMARVRQIQVRTHRMVNDVLSGAYRSRFRGSGIEFDEVRHYQPGDEVRSIDWLRTARTGEPFVKIYVEERELTLLFLVDTSASMDFGSRGASKRELAAQFCALLAYVALRQQDRVGLTLFGARPGLHLEPRKGAGAVARVVREVIAAPPTPGAADLQAVLELQGRTLRRGRLLFVISDFLPRAGQPAGVEPAWVETLARLARRHDVVAVRISDPLEERLPAAGHIRLRAIGGGGELDVDTGSERVRALWEQAAQRRREALLAHLGRARAELLELSTGGTLAEPVVRYFRRRMSRRVRVR